MNEMIRDYINAFVFPVHGTGAKCEQTVVVSKA